MSGMLLIGARPVLLRLACWAALLLMPSGVRAQWAVEFSGPVTPNAVAVDAVGAVYVAGRYDGPAALDPRRQGPRLEHGGSADLFLAKYDAFGDHEWSFGIGGAGYDAAFDVACDGKGNLYVTGTFEGGVDFDPGPGQAYLDAVRNRDIFLASYDADGGYRWAFRVGGEFSEAGHAVAVDTRENVYVGGMGEFWITADFDPGPGESLHTSRYSPDLFAAAYGPGSRFRWAFTTGDRGEDTVVDMAVDEAGSVYLTGSMQGASDFDPGPNVAKVSTSGAFQPFVAKYDSTGGYQWAFCLTGSGFGVGHRIAVDHTGHFFIGGTYNKTLDFDPGPDLAKIESPDARNGFLARYDTSGAYGWAISIGAGQYESIDALAVDETGDVYVAGSFEGTVDFDPADGVASLTSLGGTDAFVAGYDADGRYRWAFSIGSSRTAHFDLIQGMAVDAFGGLVITGRLSGEADLDPGSETFHAGEDGAAFVARYGTDGTFAETAPRLQAFEQRPPFPNPFRESATWHLRVEHPQPVRIELFDMLGRSVGTVYQGFLQAGVPAEIPIEGRGLSSGVYVLRAQGSGFTTSQVIIRL